MPSLAWNEELEDEAEREDEATFIRFQTSRSVSNMYNCAYSGRSPVGLKEPMRWQICPLTLKTYGPRPSFMVSLILAPIEVIANIVLYCLICLKK